MSIQVRIKKYLAEKGISVKAFEERCGLSNGAVSKMGDNTRRSTIDKISIVYPDLNTSWLLTGEGEMLRKQEKVVNQTLNNVSNSIVSGGNNSGSIYQGGAPNTVGSAKAPIVPRPITRVPNLDVLEYVQRQGGGIELSRVIIEDVPVSVWYYVEDTALSPNFMVGDMVALTSNTTGVVNFVPGRVYAIDTFSLGMLLRVLYKDGENLRAHSYNADVYPDFVIEGKDVIRIYKVMSMVRFNNG